MTLVPDAQPPETKSSKRRQANRLRLTCVLHHVPGSEEPSILALQLVFATGFKIQDKGAHDNPRVSFCQSSIQEEQDQKPLCRFSVRWVSPWAQTIAYTFAERIHALAPIVMRNRRNYTIPILQGRAQRDLPTRDLTVLVRKGPC